MQGSTPLRTSFSLALISTAFFVGVFFYTSFEPAHAQVVDDASAITVTDESANVLPPDEVVVTPTDNIETVETTTDDTSVVEISEPTVTILGGESESTTPPDTNTTGTVLLEVTAPASTPTPTQSPTLSTDQPDYAPGSIATIFGNFFGALQHVLLTIVGVSEDGSTATSHSWDVDADQLGAFTTQYQLPNFYVPLYLLAANSTTGAILAETTFTDVAPDLIATKTNNAGASGTVGTSFTWTIVVKNNSASPTTATFSSGQVILLDNLPSTGATYGTPAAVVSGGSGTVSCVISSNNLTCTASGGSVTLNRNDFVTITFSATPTASGSLVNPRAAGICKADSNNVVAEADDTNNTCSDTVTVKQNQTITVTTHAPASAAYGSTFLVVATSDSGLTVAITTTGGCSIAAGTVTMTSGTTACIVHYNQSGNVTFNPAPEVIENTTAQQKIITASVTANNKIYNGTTSATIATCTLSGIVGSDAVTCSAASATFADKNFGVGKTVTATGIALAGAQASNYSLSPTTATATANIDKRPITVTAATNSKTYDRTTSAAAVGSITLGTLAAGDAAPTWTETYNNKDVGSGKTLTAAGIISDGNGGANYTLTFTNNTTGIINAVGLTISGTSASNKVYDGNTTATLNFGSASLLGIVSPDVVTINSASAAGTFADKNVGTSKAVTVTGVTLSGADAGNYTLTQPTGVIANITTKGLTILGTTANNKVYDATTAATLNTGSAALVGVVGGDSVLLKTSGASGAFADKNVGTGKAVTASGFTISGIDSSNYTLTQPTGLTANITQRAVTVSATGVDKVYDATTAATVTLSDNKIGGDAVTDNYTTATFNNKNVGHNKSVAVSGISISGADAANYSLSNTTANTAADISARALTVTALTNTKEYDGGTSALATPAVSGLQDTDTSSYTESYTNKNVGTGKTLTPSGTVSDGNGGNNYSITLVNNTTGVITAKPLTVSATGVNKVYDGTTTATVDLSTNALAGDTVIPHYVSASFADKHIGTGKTVSVSGISINGTDASNYSLSNTTANTTANITKEPLTVTATTNTKTYDGSTSAAATPAITSGSLAVGDSASFTETYDNKNVGTGKSLNPAGSVSDGNSGNNYSYTFVNDTTGVIDALSITGSITADNKIYDGDTSAIILTRTLDGVLEGDTVSYIGGTATFDTADVGTSKLVSATGLTLSGTDSGNYSVNDEATTYADITKTDATCTITGFSGTYDGNAHGASGTCTGIGGVSDVLSGLDLGSSFTDTPGGTASWTFTNANYADQDGDVPIEILALNLTGSFTADNKPYDGNTSATVLTRSPGAVIAPDVVTLTGGTATFADANAGVGKTVTLTGATLGGADAGNYTLNIVNTATANIEKADPSCSVIGYSVTYDTNAHTATGSCKGVLDDILSGLVLSGTTHTNAGDYPSDSWTFTDSTGNYNNKNGTIHDSIGKVVASVTPDAKSKQYSDSDPTLTGILAGFLPADSVNATYSRISGETPGTYTISATLSPAAVLGNYNITYKTATFTIGKEDTDVDYTGDTWVVTGGPTITTAPMQLSAHLIQDPDGYPGDISLAKVDFLLHPITGPDIQVNGVSVNASGDALTTKTVSAGEYIVTVTISPSNVYWQSPAYNGAAVVALGSTDQRVTGGGWVSDSQSKNGKDNFGFTVYYNKNGAPKGNLLFMFRGQDGYNYQLKNNSWSSGGLSFSGLNGAYFTGKATLQKIDRLTGVTVDSNGSYTFGVNMKDGGLTIPKTPDTFAITIFSPGGSIWKQLGTAASQITLGGGNVVVQSK
jgi:hypothetical protein